MKKLKKLMTVAVFTAFIVAFTACGGTDDADSQPQQDRQSQQNVTQTAPDSQPRTAPQSMPEQTLDTAPQQKEDAVQKFNTADVIVTAVDGGVEYTFNSLPANADDVKALLEVYPATDKHNTAAFFMAALVRYIDSEKDGLAMIDVLKGPEKLSDTAKAFIKERFSDKLYLPKAYFEGAVPENNYEPDSPWTLIIYDDPVAPPDGYTYVKVATSGADSPRRITLRLKGEENFIWEYSGVLMGIRLPAEEDPWM